MLGKQSFAAWEKMLWRDTEVQWKYQTRGREHFHCLSLSIKFSFFFSCRSELYSFQLFTSTGQGKSNFFSYCYSSVNTISQKNTATVFWLINKKCQSCFSLETEKVQYVCFFKAVWFLGKPKKIIFFNSLKLLRFV